VNDFEAVDYSELLNEYNTNKDKINAVFETLDPEEKGDRLWATLIP
jgi:hypothetical protein